MLKIRRSRKDELRKAGQDAVTHSIVEILDALNKPVEALADVVGAKLDEQDKRIAALERAIIAATDVGTPRPFVVPDPPDGAA